MPFKSQAQRRVLHARHPEIANRWEREYKTPKNLPEHAPSREAMKHVVNSHLESVKKKKEKHR